MPDWGEDVDGSSRLPLSSEGAAPAFRSAPVEDPRASWHAAGMGKRLLVVKEAFAARGGGVELLPALGSDQVPPRPFAVTLRAPDGSELRTRASAVVAHARGPLPPLAMIRLADIPVEAVPPGSEICLDD